MSLTITLTADTETGAGVNFNTGYAAFFKDFTPYETPLFLGPEDGSETTQILHLDTPVSGQEAETRAVLLEGDDFLYTFSNHSVSGTIDTVRLVQLGAAYDTASGNLVTDDGVVTAATDYITISGLGITNPAGVKGEVHEIVAGLMGGGMNGTSADASALTEHVWASAHLLIGSTGADTYTGTAYGDTIRGMNGNDTLAGGKGADRIDGGAGDDVLSGGKGRDVFIFRSAAQADGDRITDFNADADRINLSSIDANRTSGHAGDDAFTFIGNDAFSGTAGELRVFGDGNLTVVAGDTNGDGTADFRIFLSGHLDLESANFWL